MNIQLVIIDPQIDFMDQPGSALPVPGATEDMKRLAAMIDRIPARKINRIHVTLDSHQAIDVGHPGMWRGRNGEEPSGFTMITADMIEAGEWTPIFAMSKPAALALPDGTPRTVRQYMIDYARQLEAQGKYNLMVWPEHCLVGSLGYSVQPDLFAALNRWAKQKKATINFVAKGSNPYTEHYGALRAEVPLPSDPDTDLRSDLLEILRDADMVIFAGEALSHCLRETITQIVNELDPALVSKLYLLIDCTSSIGVTPDADFPALSAAWLKDVVAKGLNIITSTDFLA